MQQVLGYSPTKAGVSWLAATLIAFAAAAVTGARLVATIGGLASGLVETMREIGGAVGVAAVSTVLISHTRQASQPAAPAALHSALLNGFHAAYLVILSWPRSAASSPPPDTRDAAPPSRARIDTRPRHPGRVRRRRSRITPTQTPNQTGRPLKAAVTIGWSGCPTEPAQSSTRAVADLMKHCCELSRDPELPAAQGGALGCLPDSLAFRSSPLSAAPSINTSVPNSKRPPA
jgi:hypothetical protein